MTPSLGNPLILNRVSRLLLVVSTILVGCSDSPEPDKVAKPPQNNA